MMRPPISLPLLLALLLLSACAGGVDPVAFERAAADEIARRPAFYTNGDSRAFLVARDGQARGLLWGTLHIRYSGDTVMPRAIRDYFGEASDLTVEIPLDRLPAAYRRAINQARRQLMLSPDPEALARLDPSTRAALDAADLPAGSTGRLSLTGLTRALLDQALAEPFGAPPRRDFVDLNLIGFARSRELPVHGLDTPEAVVALLSGNPNGADAAANLRLVLRQRESFRDLMTWARTRYGRGQVAQVIAGLSGWKAESSDLERADRQHDILLADRNRAWVPLLDAIFDRPGFHFVAFGAAHLLGEDGVVALLRQRGWQVLPCPDDTCPALGRERSAAVASWKQTAVDHDAAPTRLRRGMLRD